jgi:hypothetical protein
VQQMMVGFALLLMHMQPPRLTTTGPSFLSLPSPPPLPYRIVALLKLSRLSADGADGLIRGLTIVRRLHFFFHLPCPPVPTRISLPRSRCTREDYVHKELSCNKVMCPWRIVRGRTHVCRPQTYLIALITALIARQTRRPGIGLANEMTPSGACSHAISLAKLLVARADTCQRSPVVGRSSSCVAVQT